MSKVNGKRETPTPQKRGPKMALIALAVIAGIAVTAVGAWKLLVVAPDVSDNDRPNSTVQSGTNHPSGSNTENTEQDVPETETVSGRKEDYYTFLLLGKDTGGGSNTDTMLLVSYDVPNGTVDFVSIPRDTMINVSWTIKKINAVYASSRGVEGLKEEIGHLTGVVPDFYVTVEWEAIGEIVNALGGVWFDVPYNMNYDDPYQDLYIHQEKGYRLLDGEDAMQVIRWRKNNGESYGIGDSGRQQVQQDFLKAVAKQCLQIGNWTKISAFAEIFFRNVETDIPWNNVLWFAQKAMGISVDSICFHSLPGNDQGWYYTPSLGGNLSYFFADPEGIVELVNAHFNPFRQDITEEDLQIVYKNKDASLGVTNGELADPKMAVPSVKPSTSKPSASSKDENTDHAGGETTDPGAAGTGGETSDPGTDGTGGETSDPGTDGTGGETSDPGTDGTGGETTDPGTDGTGGETNDPGTGGTGGETNDPGTGGTGGETSDPGMDGTGGESSDPGTGSTGDEPTNPTTGAENHETTGAGDSGETGTDEPVLPDEPQLPDESVTPPENTTGASDTQTE